MASVLRYHVLLEGSAAATGDWVLLDTRYESDIARTITAILSGGDSIRLEGTTFDRRGGFLPSEIPAGDIVTIATLNSSGPYKLEGTYRAIRAVKVGSAATAKVAGMI